MKGRTQLFSPFPRCPRPLPRSPALRWHPRSPAARGSSTPASCPDLRPKVPHKLFGAGLDVFDARMIFCSLVMVSSNAPRRGTSPPRPLRAPPRLAIGPARPPISGTRHSGKGCARRVTWTAGIFCLSIDGRRESKSGSPRLHRNWSG